MLNKQYAIIARTKKTSNYKSQTWFMSHTNFFSSSTLADRLQLALESVCCIQTSKSASAQPEPDLCGNFSCYEQELNRTCRAMQQRVLELIPRVQHEQLTEELLLINDNLNNVFLRHERYLSPPCSAPP